MNPRVAITGMGITSAIGTDVHSNFLSLKEGKSGLSKAEFLNTCYTDLPLGEIKMSNADLRKTLQIAQERVFTRAALLGAKAGKEALQDAAILGSDDDLSFINGTSVGGMDFIESTYKNFPNLPKSHRADEAQHPGFTTNSIAEYLGITGLVSTLSTACSSGANALLFGAKLIQSGTQKRVLAGGTDCLSKFTMNGFNSLRILSDKACRPFDRNRDGLNLGEGAAYLVLEDEELAKHKKIYGYLEGFGNANDAHHQTASSKNGDGAFLAMQQALGSTTYKMAGVDYINAHGTATINNDLTEGKAIQRLFDKLKLPPITSTKPFTGHTLAAAGAMEAVYSVFSLQHQCVFPTLNFQENMKKLNFSPQTVFKSQKIRKTLSNSFGFGGNCTALLFSKK